MFYRWCKHFSIWEKCKWGLVLFSCGRTRRWRLFSDLHFESGPGYWLAPGPAKYVFAGLGLCLPMSLICVCWPNSRKNEDITVWWHQFCLRSNEALDTVSASEKHKIQTQIISGSAERVRSLVLAQWLQSVRCLVWPQSRAYLRI